MQDPKTATARKTLSVALLSVVGGLVGVWAGRGVADAQHGRAGCVGRGRDDLHLIDRALLTQACQSYGVTVEIVNPAQGLLSPGAGHEYDFLCILDRRAYIATLIPNHLEKYEAASRVQK